MTQNYTIVYFDEDDYTHEVPFRGTEEEVQAEAMRLAQIHPTHTTVYNADGAYIGYAVWGEYFNATDADDDDDWEDEWDDEPCDPFDEVGYNPYMGGFDPDC